MSAQSSPAMTWLHFLWQHQGKPTQYGYRCAMAQALITAIEMGLRFEQGDFGYLATNTTPSYYDTSPFGRGWLTESERFYRVAIEARNLSACKAYEHWKGRAPFFWGGTRLFVGWRTFWKATQEHVHCTSFHDAKGTVTLCSYRRSPMERCQTCGGWTYADGQRKVLHRYTLTPEQVREASTAVSQEGTS